MIKQIMVDELTTSERDRQEIRKLGLKDLLFFNKVILNYKDITEEVHGEWVKFKKNSRKKKKLILVPREHFKTSFFTIGETIQDMLKNPNERILLTNATLGNAQSFLREIKEHVQRNEKLKYYYPEVKEWESGASKWTEKQIIIPRTRVGKEPTIETTGVGGNLVSQHYDKIKLDDLVSLENASTRLQAEKVIEYFKYCLSLLETNGELTVIGTRWAYYELYQFILDKLKRDFDIFIKDCWRNKEKTIPYFPEKFSKEKLNELKRIQGSYIFSCFPKGSPILMADWIEKPIEKIQVGEEVIGFETDIKTGRRRLVKTKVLHKEIDYQSIQKVFLESGRIIRSTSDHKWFSGRGIKDKIHPEYYEAKIGRELRHIGISHLPELSEEQKKWAYWLGGIFDGEGSCSLGETIFITQSQEHNPEIYQGIKNALEILNFSYGESKRKGFLKNGVNHAESSQFYLKGGMREMRRFLLQCQPLKGFKIEQSIWEHGKRFIKEKDKIIEIVSDGFEPVYKFQTTTGNYFAYGYASKNCQYENEPLDIETAIFKKSTFKYYDKIPELLYITTTVDPNLSEKLKANYGVILTLGQDLRKNLYVLDIIREKMNPYMLINRMLMTHLKWKPKIIGVEQNALQKTLGYFFDEVLSHRKVSLPIMPIKVDNQKSKEMRISALQPLFEQGRIYFPKDHSYLKDMEGELTKFPLAATDDIADALASQLEFTQPPDAPKELDDDHPITLQDKVFKEQRDIAKQRPGIRQSSSEFVDDVLGIDF